MAFEYSRRELADIGIDNVKKFRAVLHSVRNMECEDRRRALEAKRGGASPTKRGKNGIMRGMKKNANLAVLAALAIVGAMAAPLRSDASARKDSRTTVCLSVAMPIGTGIML